MSIARHRIRLALVLLPLLGPALAHAAGPLNLDTQGIAIHGHDPVAYFTMNNPVKGSQQLSASVAGATYWFASEANLQAFKAEPARYLPQYGGVGIVALARRLAIALWRYLQHGEIPAGAVLKPATT